MFNRAQYEKIMEELAKNEVGSITLLLKDGTLSQQKKSIQNNERVVFGSGGTANIRLKSKETAVVFPIHCEITCENGVLFLEKPFRLFVSFDICIFVKSFSYFFISHLLK